MKQRPAEFTALVGGPGSGKTFKTHAILKELVKNGDRALVIDPSKSNKLFQRYLPKRVDSKGQTMPIYHSIEKIKPDFKGFKVVGYKKPTKDEPGTFTHLWNRIDSGELTDFNLVLDDTNMFARTNVEQNLQNIITLSRNKSIDIWCTAHSLKGVPLFFGSYITVFGFLPVRGFSPERKRDFEFYHDLAQVMKRVNRTAETTKNPHHIEFCDQYGRPLK